MAPVRHTPLERRFGTRKRVVAGGTKRRERGREPGRNHPTAIDADGASAR